MAYHFGLTICPKWKKKFPQWKNYIYLPIFLILPAVELQPERPEGSRRRAKLHLGKIYFFNSFYRWFLLLPICQKSVQKRNVLALLFIFNKKGMQIFIKFIARTKLTTLQKLIPAVFLWRNMAFK